MKIDMSELAQIGIYMGGGLGMLGILLTIFRFIRKSNPNPEKLSTYESGEEPVGQGIAYYNSKYYMVGLIFLIFELEIIFLFPWAEQSLPAGHQYATYRWFSLAEMGFFLLVLILGFAFVWQKGYLDWLKPQNTFDADQNKATLDKYKKINEA